MPRRPIVPQIPVERLFDATGAVAARQGRFLSKEAIREMLRSGPVEFVIADVGLPLRRIEVGDCYEFWKTEVRPHVVDTPDAGFQLEDFPGEYAYVASQWSGQTKTPIVLLEKHH